MPRHDGNTRRGNDHRGRKGGHRMHRRNRLARLAARVGKGQHATAWGRANPGS